MFTASATLYDLIYSFKDYQKEAEEIIAILKARLPHCKTILDVGCGTGEHHIYFKEHYQIDGIDLGEAFIPIAQRKNPEGEYFVADMANFDLGKRYDAVICLFSSIGYLHSHEHLHAALRCFDNHLNDGGLVIVEPWFTPDSWNPGRVHMLTYDKDDIKICRMSQGSVEGRLSIVHFHYLVGTQEDGIRYFEERHELSLFTRDEMTAAFEGAGLQVDYSASGLMGRGMYYGKR